MIIYEVSGGTDYMVIGRSGAFPHYGARQFRPTAAGLVDSITVKIKATTARDNYAVRMVLRADDAGEPDDAVMELSTTILSSITLAGVNYTFDFAGTTALALLTDYWMVIYRTENQYSSVNVYADEAVANDARNDFDGLQPWNPTDDVMDLKIEGGLAGPGGRSWGVIIV